MSNDEKERKDRLEELWKQVSKKIEKSYPRRRVKTSVTDDMVKRIKRN